MHGYGVAKGRLASDKNRQYFLDNLFIWEEFPESLHDFYNTLGSLYYFGNEKPFFEENKEKAFQWYCLAAAEGDTQGYYQYLSDNRLALSENLVLSKAVSSLDYKWTSIDMIYGVWYTYSASSSKLKVIELLSRAWEDGTDPVVLEIKENIKNSEYFPSDFIEECVMASYTYSYRALAKTYGIIPNRGREDAKKIEFAKVEEKNFDSLNYGDMASIKFNTDYRAYYELDFDGDGSRGIRGRRLAVS